MVTFYETDIRDNEYVSLRQDEQDKYTKYVYYSKNVDSNTYSNVWALDYNDVKESEKSEYIPINIYVLKPAIPLDYPFIPPTDENIQMLNIDCAWKELRRARDKALTDCDWTQNRDVPFSEEKVNEWIIYRQLLRDLPGTYTDETILNWQLPTPPT